MKKFLALALSLAMVLPLVACGSSSSSSSSSDSTTSSDTQATTDTAVEATHLKLGHPSAEGGPYDVMSKKFAELIEEKTGGRYVIDIYAANALGTQEESLDSVSMGTLDFCVTDDGTLAKYEDEWGYLGLPFVFEDVDDVDENMNGELGAYLSGLLESDNMRVISFFENGFRNVTANKEIQTPADLKGVKIRTATSEGLMAFFQGTGAVVTNISFSELYSALQLGTCEAQENPFANIRDKKFYEVQDYLMVTFHSHTTEPLVMSLDTYNALSAEDQAIFEECGLEASKYAYQYAKDQNDDNRAYLETVMNVVDVDRSVWEEFAETTNAPFMEKYASVAALKK
jgi:tripartite ATP-independent transporter DctP family solute receptor